VCAPRAPRNPQSAFAPQGGCQPHGLPPGACEASTCRWNRRCFGGDDPYQPVVSADTGVPHREPGQAIVSLSLRPADPRCSLTRTR
jgi:hypothetical protein